MTGESLTQDPEGGDRHALAVLKDVFLAILAVFRHLLYKLPLTPLLKAVLWLNLLYQETSGH